MKIRAGHEKSYCTLVALNYELKLFAKKQAQGEAIVKGLQRNY
jgi:hypothetical protein